MSAIVPSVLTVAAALLADACATFVRRFLPSATRIVLVGGVDSLAEALTRWSGLSDVEVVGALEVVQEPQTALPDLHVSLGLTEDSPAVARIEGLREVPQWAGSWDADTVVVLPGTGVSADSLRLLGWHLERTPTTLAVAGVFDPVAPHRITTTRVGTTTLLVARPSRPRLPHRVAKWVFDRAAGLLLLVLALPLLVFLCLMIRLDSSGPSLFRQVRVGRGGRPFTMVKLRTMHTDAEARKATLADADEGNGVLFKIRHDPRVTSVGRFLRRSSLDELPQLVNVILGQMSLVGPRPALPDEVADYDEHEHRRYAVRPGMTGLWQVSGRSDLSWEESMELDLQYVDNHATGADATILFRTFWAVVRSKGAY